MPGAVGAQRSSADTGRLCYCAERVAENKGTFELGPFCLRQSSSWHGVRYPITIARFIVKATHWTASFLQLQEMISICQLVRSRIAAAVLICRQI